MVVLSLVVVVARRLGGVSVRRSCRRCAGLELAGINWR